MTVVAYDSLAAEVYDLDKPIGHSFGDVEFYRERLASCSGRVLEPAVGTGRVMIPLLQSGLVVDGFDGSRSMLNLCRARCSERGLEPTLFEGEMQTFSVSHRYEAIIMPAGSFLLLHERRESLEVLERFREHLLPGGRLMLDLTLQTEPAVGPSPTRTFTTAGDDVITLQSDLVAVDFLHQHTVAHLRYEKWRGGRLVESELQVFPLRWYGVEEFELVLKSVGFRDVVVSSDYRYGEAPSDAAQTFTFEARRA